MTEEERWMKVREIVREENAALEQRLLAALTKKPKIELVNGRWTGITEGQLTSWKAAYPACDLEAEINRAAAWISSNPQGAPKNCARFINNWLGKVQDRAAIRSIPGPSSITPSLCEYCHRPSVGAVSGRRHCREHTQDAMNGPPRKMHAVTAKPVAGA